MNLVNLILKLIGGGDILSRIASTLGIGTEQASKAVNAAVPSLLAGLVGSASKPEGAAQLANVLAKQDPGLLDNISGFLSQGANVGTGSSNPLSSLLGGGGLNQMAGALSKFTGIGEGGVSKLLGMLSPIVLGAVGKQAKGMDASGLASMLMAQKSNIASALPSGLGSMLSSAVPGLAGILGGAANTAGAAVRGAANTAGAAVRDTAAAASDTARQVGAAGSSVGKWLLIGILVVLALVFLPRMFRRASTTGSDIIRPVENVVTGSPVGAKFVSDVSALMKDATEAVASVKDEATATTALPKIQEINTKLAGLKSTWSGLPASVQKVAGDTLRPLIAKLREVLKPALGLPVVGEKIKPAVEQMLGTLESFTAAQ